MPALGRGQSSTERTLRQTDRLPSQCGYALVGTRPATPGNASASHHHGDRRHLIRRHFRCAAKLRNAGDPPGLESSSSLMLLHSNSKGSMRRCAEKGPQIYVPNSNRHPLAPIPDPKTGNSEGDQSSFKFKAKIGCKISPIDYHPGSSLPRSEINERPCQVTQTSHQRSPSSTWQNSGRSCDVLPGKPCLLRHNRKCRRQT